MAQNLLNSAGSIGSIGQNIAVKPTAEPVKTGATSESYSFSAELGKQLKPAQTETKSDSQTKVKSSSEHPDQAQPSEAETEKNAPANGKKLPDEQADATKETTTASNQHADVDKTEKNDNAQSADVKTDTDAINFNPETAATQVVTDDDSESPHIKHTVDTEQQLSSNSDDKTVTDTTKSANGLQSSPQPPIDVANNLKQDKQSVSAEGQVELNHGSEVKLVASKQTDENSEQTHSQKSDDGHNSVDTKSDAQLIASQTQVVTNSDVQPKVVAAQNGQADQSDTEESQQSKAVKFDNRMAAQTQTSGSGQQRKLVPNQTVTDTSEAAAVVTGGVETANSKQLKDDTKSSAVIREDILQALTAKKSQGEAGGDDSVKNNAKSTTSIGQQVAALVKPEQHAAQRMESTDARPFNTLLGTSGGTTANGNSATNASSQSSSAGVANTQPALDVQPSMQSAAWARVMTSRVVWMAREGVQQAQLKLNPANMGPVEVKVHMHNEQASVTFVAHHAATRDALEQALPKLRDSFAENGLALANAEVSQQQTSDGQQQQDETLESEIVTQANVIDDDNIIEDDNQLGSKDSTVVTGLSLYA